MENIQELRKLISNFESQRLTPERWHHGEHLRVATWYLAHFELDVALSKIKDGIQKLNAANGVKQSADGGYHESLTMFLALKIHQRLRAMPEKASIEEKIGVIENEFADFKRMVLESYSRERINSWEARTTWIEPDLEPVD